MGFSTKQIHAGVVPDPVTGSILTPIYQTTTYVQDSVDEYLAKGYPIATGVIEGESRHLIKDRMDVTGAR